MGRTIALLAGVGLTAAWGCTGGVVGTGLGGAGEGAQPGAGEERRAGWALPDGGVTQVDADAEVPEADGAAGEPDGGIEPAPPPPPPPPAKHYVTPTGGDDTAALTDAIAAHAEVFIKDRLLIRGTATIRGLTGRRVVFEGWGYLFRDHIPAERGAAMLSIEESSDITIERPWIRGSATGCVRNDATEGQHAIRILSSADVRIHDAWLFDVPGDGIYLGAKGKVRPTNERVTIERPTIACVGRSAISAVAVWGGRVNGGSYSRVGLIVFNVEPFSERFVDDYVVHEPWVEETGTRPLFWVSGPYLSQGAVEAFNCRVTNTLLRRPRFGANASSYAGINTCVNGGARIER